jgi:hypothetical protein
MSDVQITQFEGDGVKRGIGGRDCFVINIRSGDGYEGNEITPLLVGQHRNGIRFEEDGRSFVVSVKAFNSLVKWLKSWGYL